MTVTYLKDGRIEVKNPHDALLLSLAGVKIEYLWGKEWIFDVNKNTLPDLCDNEGGFVTNNMWIDTHLPLYVPADVARGLVLVLCQILGDLVTWGGEDITMATPSEYLKNPTWDNIYVRRHNDRWNLLPEIEMEMEK